MINKKSAITKITLLICLLFLSIICATIIYKEKIYHAKKLASSKVNAEGLVNILANYLELNFSYIELIIDEIINEKQFHFDDSVFKYVNNKIHYLKALIHIDEFGDSKIFANNQSYKERFNIDYSKADFYLYHKANSDLNLKISKLETEGKLIVVLSKRIEDKDNQFKGIIAIAFKDNYLNYFFESIRRNKQTEMAVLTDKGQFLFQSDDIIEDIDVKYSIKEESEYFNLDTLETISVHKYKNTYLNIFAFKHLSKWPLSIALVSYEGDIVKKFLLNIENLNLFLVIAVFILILVSFCASILLKYFEETEKLERLMIIEEKSKTDIAVKILNQNQTSLEAIIAFSNMLYSEYLGSLNPKQKNKVVQIRDWTKHLCEITNDITKSFNSPDTLTKLKLSLVEIDKIFEKAILMLEENFLFKKITIVYQEDKYDNFRKLKIYIDQLKVMQIFISLLEFLIEYSEKKSLITWYSSFDENNNIVFAILSDNFLLNNDEITNIFLSGSKYVDDITIKISLAKFFVEMHNGRLSYEVHNKMLAIKMNLPNQKLL